MKYGRSTQKTLRGHLAAGTLLLLVTVMMGWRLATEKSNWGELSNMATVLGAIVAAIAIPLAQWSTRQTIERNNQAMRSSATASISANCAERYTELAAFKLDIIKFGLEIKDDQDNKKPVSPTRMELHGALADEYYRRLWALKSDQYDYWLCGVLDHDTFFDWCYYLFVKMVRDFHSSGSADSLPTSLKQSWDVWSSVGNGLNHGGANPRFVKLTNDLFKIAEKTKKDVDSTTVSTIVLDIMEDLERHAEVFRKQFWEGMTFDEFRKQAMADIRTFRVSSLP